MTVRRVLLTGALLLTSAAPRLARAQWAIAPFIGREFEEESDWMIFGGEARFVLHPSAWSINPRFTYHPLTGGNILQLDANAVYDFKPASGPVTPYLGAGVGWVHFSFDEGNGGGSSSKVVGNWVAGLRLHLSSNSKIEPYAHSEYSFAKQYTNSYQIVLGLMIWMQK